MKKSDKLASRHTKGKALSLPWRRILSDTWGRRDPREWKQSHSQQASVLGGGPLPSVRLSGDADLNAKSISGLLGWAVHRMGS